MRIIADLHIHSKYSRATSKDMDIPNLSKWAKYKCIGLMGTGDFTHPLWLHELKAALSPAAGGLYQHEGVNFMLTAEVCNIFSIGGMVKRVHNIIFAPSFEVVDKINKQLGYVGNLEADGRPIFGLSAVELVRIVLDASPDCFIVPGHCLLPDTMVHTREGLKQIKDITNNDYVYTHKMRFKKVDKSLKREYSGRIFQIRPYYFREGIKVTPEHPFYIIKTYKNCPSRNSFCMPSCSHLKHKGCRRLFFRNYHPQWVQAKDIEINDIMVYPRFNKQTIDKGYIHIDRLLPKGFVFKKWKIGYPASRTFFIKNKINVDKDFCRLTGYFLSEGYTNSRDCVSFCFLENEKAYIKDVIGLMKKIFGVKLSKKQTKKGVKGVELIFYSKVLFEMFSHLFYTNTKIKRAHSKCLPNWMLILPFEKQAEIIKGWWRGDTGYTSSCILMNQMKVLLLRLGIVPSITSESSQKHKRRGKHFIGTREIFSRHSSFHFSNLSFFEDKFYLLKDSSFRKFKTKRDSRHGWVDDKYIYMPVRQILQEAHQGYVYNLEVDDDNSYVCDFALVHNCWTPWFGIFGANSGFDSVEECFGKEAKNIYCLETGLSSDPAMNWRLSALDKYSLISNSYAHSPAKIGREANIFDCEMSYKEIVGVLKAKDKKRFLYTVEFFPEEGKYHWDGQRACQVSQAPNETKENNYKCRVCGKPVTVGVMHRVEKLADRPEGFIPPDAVPFKNMIPLLEIIAEARSKSVQTQAVEDEYAMLVKRWTSEFNILFDMPQEEIRVNMPVRIAEAILRVRDKKVHIAPGYDGVYGQIEIFSQKEAGAKDEKQLELF